MGAFGARARACGAAALAALLGCASEQPPPRPELEPLPAAAPPGPGSPAEKTAADPALQRDVTKLIDQCEQKLGASGKVVDTAFASLDDGTLVESWTVARGASQVVYTVRLTPGENGTEIGIQCPPKPRVK